MASAWKSPEDFENDLWAFSETNDDGNTHDPPPLTILQYNAEIEANSNSSIFDTDYSNEPVIYLSTGRGRGGISQMFRPGITVKNDDEDEHTLQKYLRKVSGLGYSNELIQKSFKKSTPQPKEEFCDAECDNSDNYSTSDQTNRLKMTTPSKESLSNHVSIRSSPIGVNPVEQPLPLSVILCQAKKNMKTDKQNTVRKKIHTLNPEAPVFKVLSLNQNVQSNRLLDESPQTSESIESDNIESYSSGDEPSRKKRNGIHSGRDFTRNCNVNRLLLNDIPLERNTISWRQKNRKTFNVDSVSDFPPL
ncbi:uncharacterized protein LOC130446734 [Diorhabda sublineata]|uniref:uncharacterized protein LOC130446734 n=1 Tax=Diorhabda sublineata TaxID=1163346 RepID=UPI0024E10E42|nr:uncharacterized protein LOC130446734 [Diorhabda sublineata]